MGRSLRLEASRWETVSHSCSVRTHFVLLLSPSINLLTFQKGQLGRPILDMPYWNAKPSPMPNIGAKYGRKATWIGASGDQTFLRIDEALINSHVLATSEIFASKHIIGLVPSSVSEPPPFKCLLINKMDGSCRTFNDSEQEDLQGFGLCLDPIYDVIWRWVKHRIWQGKHCHKQCQMHQNISFIFLENPSSNIPFLLNPPSCLLLSACV